MGFVVPRMLELWNKIVDLLERASNQRHIVALRDGMIGAVPIILVGSTFLLLGIQGQPMQKYFPSVAASDFGVWYLEIAPILLKPFRLTMGLLSLYVAFTIAAALARQYEVPEIPNGLTAVATFLLSGQIVRGTTVDGDGKELLSGLVIQVEPLGASGLFLAIIVGLLTVEISRHLTFTPKKVGDGYEGGIPPAVVHAFASFLPMLVCVSLMWLVRYGIGIDVYEGLKEATAPIKQLGDTYGAVMGVNVLLHLFGVAGVHGISVINAGMLPIWQEYVVSNAEAHEAGKMLPYVTAYPFYQWFIWIGGAGATLAPTIRCMFSKNAHVKKIGRVSIVPAMFNINEPLLFGLPVVANPVLGIPFIVAPLVCGTIAFFATSMGFVGKAFVEVPWVMPCFLGAYLSTQDVMALVLLGVNLFVSYLIWSPFISLYERRLLENPVDHDSLGDQGLPPEDAPEPTPPDAPPQPGKEVDIEPEGD